MRGLFINNKKAQDSIYESGRMVFDCLTISSKYKLDYIEVSEEQRTISLGYDFYFFNYHPSTMSWMDTASLKKLPGLIMTMVLEVLPGDPFVLCPDNHFHGYCVLDPTIRPTRKVFPFPRPLETVEDIKPYIPGDIPVIGSFGFATKGKGFQHVVEAVNKEFDKAVVRINIPHGDFVPESKAYAAFLADRCRSIAKPGISVVVSHDYMRKKELIDWCAENTLNCFLYDRNMPGLAATTDQAIVSGRPLAVSQNDTFRHILSYLPAYPACSLKDAIETSVPAVKQMQEEWSPRFFAVKFEEMLAGLSGRLSNKIATGDFTIPVVKNNFAGLLQKRYRKYKRLLTPGKLKQFFSGKRKGKDEELI